MCVVCVNVVCYMFECLQRAYSNAPCVCMCPSSLHVRTHMCSVLHLSCMVGTSSCVKVLLDVGKCNVNAARQSDGYTPLHVAAAEGHLQCAELLLQQGAGVNSRDRSAEG